MENLERFDVELNGQTIRVSDHTFGALRVFHVVYPNRRPSLNITIAENADGVKFWNSLPEGRQEEAEMAGRAIASYIREYRKKQSGVPLTD